MVLHSSLEKVITCFSSKGLLTPIPTVNTSPFLLLLDVLAMAQAILVRTDPYTNRSTKSPFPLMFPQDNA